MVLNNFEFDASDIDFVRFGPLGNLAQILV
jgi:hypothetical protein